MIHARIQEFSSVGGGGGVGSRSIWHLKKARTTLFYFYFLVLNLFYRSPVVTFKENYYLPRFQWGWNIFQGDPTFYMGSNRFSPIETHITCDFPGGPDPLPPPPPLWIRPCDSAHRGLIYLLVFRFSFSI